MTDPKTLRVLAAELCEAKEGSEELDARITAAINGAIVERYPPPTDYGPSARWKFLSPTDRVFLGNEYRPPFGNPVTQHRPLPHGKAGLAPYTTSLDTKLPGEDIVLVGAPDFVRSVVGSNELWYAQTRWGITAEAPTEPLARRAAALLAMAERKEREG